jgi:hypothetical protein
VFNNNRFVFALDSTVVSSVDASLDGFCLEWRLHSTTDLYSVVHPALRTFFTAGCAAQLIACSHNAVDCTTGCMCDYMQSVSHL